MAEDAIGKVRKRTAAQSHSQEQPGIPDPLAPRPPTPPSPSLPPPAQPLWSWCRARAATGLSKVRSPAVAKNTTEKSRQASEADSKRSIATCAALALAVSSKEINLSAQPGRWETLGKLWGFGCMHTAEFARHFKSPGLVNYTGGCHCCTVKFEPRPCKPVSSGLQLQAVQEEAAQIPPPPSLTLHAPPGRWEHHYLLIPHPPGAAQLLQQVQGAEFPRVHLWPGDLQRRLTLPGRGEIFLKVKLTDTWRPPYSRTIPCSALSNSANLPFKCCMFMALETSPGKRISIVTLNLSFAVVVCSATSAHQWFFFKLIQFVQLLLLIRKGVRISNLFTRRS